MSPVVVQRRGGLVETRHPFSVRVWQDGAVREALGPDVASFWRSASKPFQLLTSLEQLPSAEVAALTDAELALGTASHSGEPGHVAGVEALLARFRLGADALQCGAHLPMHEPSARLAAEARAVHNNCSGKHTFMLAACHARGWEPDYRPLAHPLQAANRRRIDEVAGHAHDTAVDGCSVPTFHAPLSAQARAWGALAEAMAAGDGLLARVGWAIQRQPWFMSGTGRLDEAAIRGASEPMAGKIGAEGLFCVALPARRLSLAVKVHTGNTDTLAVALRWALARVGVEVAGEWPWAEVKNVRGAPVGDRVVEG